MTLSILRRAFALPALAILFCLASGCGYGSSSRVPVSGTVTLNGDPVDGGVITFLPSGDFPSGVKAVPVNVEILMGKYTIPAARGPYPGKYRVQIIWNRKTGREIPSNDPPNMVEEVVQYVPLNYNARTSLEAEIEAKANVKDFELKGLPPSDQKTPGAAPKSKAQGDS